MTTPLTFVTFKWANPGYRSKFGPETVLTLRNMIGRHYKKPHRFVCITDDTTGLEGVDTIPLWPDHADIKNPHGKRNPSCYRRLKLFAPEAAAWFGDGTVVVMDLDTVIVGDITPLFEEDVDFKIWGESDFPQTQWMNGSLWMLKIGSKPHVWTRFDPKTSPKEAARAGARGSDQGWMSYVLGKNEKTWGREDGVFSFRKHIQPIGRVPVEARMVMFHGHVDPWTTGMDRYPFVREHYR
jgi:hypothetical protein